MPQALPHSLPTLALSEREREYSPSSCIGGNYAPFIEAYRTLSARAREQCVELGGHWRVLSYGSAPWQRVDLCIPAQALAGLRPAAKVLVFIHGGYWQELSASDSLFAAAHCISQGVAFAAIDYPLAPHASLDVISAQCHQALACLVRQASALGLDAQRIVLAGSSAGAHLAAMVSLGVQDDTLPWRPHAAVLVSGIYTLEPLVGTTINHALGLDADSARRASPALRPLAGFPRSLVCWGEVETAEFKRQSRQFASALGANGTECETLEIAKRNHFDVVLDLANPDSMLGQRTLALLQAG